MGEGDVGEKSSGGKESSKNEKDHANNNNKVVYNMIAFCVT